MVAHAIQKHRAEMRRDILMCLMLASLTGDVNGTTGLVNFLKTVSFWSTCKTRKWAVGVLIHENGRNEKVFRKITYAFYAFHYLNC